MRVDQQKLDESEDLPGCMELTAKEPKSLRNVSTFDLQPECERVALEVRCLLLLLFLEIPLLGSSAGVDSEGMYPYLKRQSQARVTAAIF